LWHDFWNPLGPLLPSFSVRLIYDTAIPSNACVASIIDGGWWKWPAANSVDLIAIKNSCVDYPSLDPLRDDKISWFLSP
ncbi:hypothetical protein KK467_29440, partial [Klebsiella pneumoniae]|uniref:hypothetical protein n=1 Tax=Klebsiella pneumoniae TaxID=573 RepID=UPI001BE0E7CF